MAQYHIQWIEKNKDGSTSHEGLTTGARNREDAINQIYTIGNVVDILKIERLN